MLIVEWRRLTVASLVSVALHAFTLTQIGHGSEDVSDYLFQKSTDQKLSARLLVPTAYTLNNASSRAEQENDDTEDHLLERLSDEANGTSKGQDNLMQLPTDDEVGPPYPPLLPDYLPAGMLDTPPHALAELDTRFPALEGRNLAGRMVFSLLIDEHGQVNEVLNEYSGLGPDVVEIVQQSLIAMSFIPGVMAGKSVKSRYRIEVVLSYSVM